MPPKKGKKKTKAELEEDRILQEAEDKKFAEAEAVRLAKEAEEAAVAAAQEKEDQITFRVDELYRLKVSYEKLAPSVESRASLLKSNLDNLNQQESWTSHLACLSRPKPTTAEMNTYISETTSRSITNLAETLTTTGVTESIITSLNTMVIKKTSLPNPDIAAINALQAFIPKLRTMCNDRMDEATVRILQNSDKYVELVVEKDLRGAVVEGKLPSREIKLMHECDGIRLGLWVNLFKKTFKTFLLDFTGLGITVTVPKVFQNLHVAVRVTHFPYGTVSSQRFARADIVLGGVFQLDILDLPPVAKQVKGWVMRQITPEGTAISKNTYPVGSALGTINMVAAQIKCSIKLPKGLILPEEPKVAWFHPIDMRWATESIFDVDFHPDTNELRFNTVSVGSIAVVQDRLMDLSYKEWSLAPVMPKGGESCGEEVRLTIKTPRFTVVIAATGPLCRLISPEIAPLAELRGQEMEAGDLLNKLQAAGLNILPEDEDAVSAKYDGSEEAGVVLKTRELEDKLCQELSYLSTSFDFCSSRWNNSVGKDRCCFQAKETDAFTGGSDLVDYNMVVIENDAMSQSAMDSLGGREGDVVKEVCVNGGMKCLLVAGGEGPSSRSFDSALVDGMQSEVYLQSCLENIACKETIARVEKSSGVMSSTVRSLLQLTRPFSFS